MENQKENITYFRVSLFNLLRCISMKINLTIPTSYSDITIKQYQKFFKLADNNDESDFLNQKTIEVLCDTDKAHLMPYSDTIDILNTISEIFKEQPKHLQRFKINGVEFGFIPNLDEMTFGEYIDINNYIDKVEDFHKALAVLYRPITVKVKQMYQIEPYVGSDAYSEVMKDAPLDALLGAKVFFYNLANELLKVTADSLSEIPKEMQQIIQQRLNLENNGDGISQFTDLLKEMLGGSMK